MTYPIMIILRFICGFIGVNTGTLREATIQNYFDRDIRARVNGINNIVISFSMILIQLIVGIGEVLSISQYCISDVYSNLNMYGGLLDEK